MTDFTFVQAAHILGITPQAFSYRARTVKGVPLARGPKFNARLVTLDTLERLSGRTFTGEEIERALAHRAKSGDGK